jgi:plastocyanin domain-containing protein
VGAFVAVAFTAFAAVVLVWPRSPAVSADKTITVSMSGFSPPVITARANQPLRLQVVNPDSSMHSDGGGWHQLAIPELGVDARIAPRSDQTIEIPGAAPGEYVFYCDICCGGKSNPGMQGVFRVSA